MSVSASAVSHEVTSGGCERHGSALYGCSGGFLTAAALPGDKQGRALGLGTLFFPLLVDPALTASLATEISDDMAAWDRAVCDKVESSYLARVHTHLSELYWNVVSASK